MGFIGKGSISAQRFVASGTLCEGWREHYRDQLNEVMPFTDDPNSLEEITLGWTRIDDMFTSTFDDFNTWLFGDYVALGFRIDKRSLPSKKFNAALRKRLEEYKEANGIERVPRSIRYEMRDLLKDEWLRRVIPRTQHIEIVWNLNSNIVYVSSHSTSVSDHVRRGFWRTFGRRLTHMSPGQWVLDGLGSEDGEQVIGRLNAAIPLRFSMR